MNTTKAYSFDDDREKMRDFAEISKDDFLYSYSYLEEEDYDATVKALKEMNMTALERYQQLLWRDYTKYLKDWADSHSDKTNFGMSPACFDEWEDNEAVYEE